MSQKPEQRAIEPQPLREIVMPGGRTREVIYDAMTVGQTGVRADGSKFTMLGFRVLAVRANR